jgi:7-cyano-7-deazaguanine synthase
MPSVVLYSGGLDSAVLLALERQHHAVVWPVYVRSGLAWEAAELRAARRLLERSPFAGRVQPLTVLDADVRDIYPPDHWAIAGRPPAYDTPDEDVYLEGRNIVLIARTSVFCARVGAERLALGPLAGNPPIDVTLSCMNPDGARACGRCSKCRERDQALDDPRPSGNRVIG